MKVEADTIQDKDGLSGTIKSVFTQVQALVRWAKTVSSGVPMRDIAKTISTSKDVQHDITFKVECGFQPTLCQLIGRGIFWYEYKVVGTSVMLTAHFNTYPVRSVYDGYLQVESTPFYVGDSVVLSFADGHEEKSKIVAKNGFGFKVSREFLTDISGIRLDTVTSNLVIM